ncbi:tetratricopeptide repeat protein [Flavobacterium sp. KACC 22763]|uniref:tetratricopeptide repeat protein n=1 Tax=Flavobacterium sp. KACC 22763 TaxID=3025668 RepID=UPI002365D3FD|nr:tetratricopeptide repeat protein [Flavobacterium sp. KACC 22763]WDF62369.1 tetratricopeptide repeat protein [Flavobacterium sp. KACC 22763]
MKNTFVLIVLLTTIQFFGQNDQKIAFQKNKYELAISYYKKADFVKAIDLFSLAAKIKPENEIGKDAVSKVDTLRGVLRKEILSQVVGTWKRTGNQPVWSSATVSVNQSAFDELVEIKENEILFYEVDKKTQVKKLVKTENLVYNDNNCNVSAFSEIILSDGTIWNCSLNDKSNILHVVNVAVKTEEGIQKIMSDNEESYYVKL